MAWDNLYLAGRGGRPYLLTDVKPQSSVQILDAAGNVIDTYSPSAGTGGHENGGRAKKFSLKSPIPPGGSFIVDGQTFQVQDGGRQEFGRGSSTPTLNTADKKGGVAKNSGGGGYQGGDGSTVSPGGFASGPNGTAALPGLIDGSGLGFQPVDIPEVKKVPYKQLNTIDELKKNGQFNRELYNQIFEDQRKKTATLIDDDLQAIGRFASETLTQQEGLAKRENQINRPELQGANSFNQGQVTQTNDFNQGELDRRIDTSLPQARGIINEQLDRGRKLAGGMLPTSTEDRLFENAANATAADQGVARGFGATSSFAKSAIDKYTVGERINLMQTGDQLTDKWLQRGMQLLVDTPIKYNPLLQQPSLTGVSQDLRGLPPANASQLTTQGAQNQQRYETSPANEMLSTDIGQEQYQTNRETQRLTQNQAWKLQAQQFNSQGGWGQQIAKLQVDAANAASAYNAANNYAGLVNQGLGNQQNFGAQQAGTGVGQAVQGNAGSSTSNPWSQALDLLSGAAGLFSGGSSGTGASKAGGSYTQAPQVKTAPVIQAPTSTGQISI